MPYTAITTRREFTTCRFFRVGNYNIVAENPGFKRSSVGPFSLEANQIARIDFKLEIGEMTQTVEVTGVAPILQTESTATGDAINSAKLTSLPLNGRNFASLTLLIPGAIALRPRAMSTVRPLPGLRQRPQVNGNREQTNNFMLDGVDINETVG